MHVSFATGGRERERGSQRELSQRELSQREMDTDTDTDTDTQREREPGSNYYNASHPVHVENEFRSCYLEGSYFVPPSHTRRHRAPGRSYLG